MSYFENAFSILNIDGFKHYLPRCPSRVAKAKAYAIAACLLLFLPNTSIADGDQTTFKTPGHGHNFVSGFFQQLDSTPIFYVACNGTEESTAFVWPAAGFGVDAKARLKSGLCAQKRIYGYTRKEPVTDTVKFEGGGVAHPDTWLACDGNSIGVDACQYFDHRFVSTLSSYLTFFLSDPDELNIEIAQSDIILRADNREQIVLEMDPSINATAMLAVLDKSSLDVEQLAQRVEESGSSVAYRVQTLAGFVEEGLMPSGDFIEGLDPNSPAVLYEEIQEFPEYYIETLVLGDLDEVGDRLGLLVAFDDQTMLRHDLVNAIRPAQ